MKMISSTINYPWLIYLDLKPWIALAKKLFASVTSSEDSLIGAMIFSASLLSSATSEVSGVSIAEVSGVSRDCSVSGDSIAEY